MKVMGWRAREVFSEIFEQALLNAGYAMDEVVVIAKQRVPIGNVSRPQKITGKTWTERIPGSLKRTIRRITKNDNVRVYAGNFRIYYARFVEMGTVKTRKQPFLRPAFQQIKNSLVKQIKDGH